MDLDALQLFQKSGEHFDAMGSGEQPNNAVGDEQSGDTAELNALRKGGFPGKCHRGQFGHKMSECRKKDEEVAKKGGKGKGKNSSEHSARQHAFLESLVARRISRQKLEPERMSQLDKWKVVEKGCRKERWKCYTRK